MFLNLGVIFAAVRGKSKLQFHLVHTLRVAGLRQHFQMVLTGNPGHCNFGLSFNR